MVPKTTGLLKNIIAADLGGLRTKMVPSNILTTEEYCCSRFVTKMVPNEIFSTKGYVYHLAFLIWLHNVWPAERLLAPPDPFTSVQFFSAGAPKKPVTIQVNIPGS